MTREGPLEIGRRVLMSESAALSELARRLDESFDAVVNLVLECKGRVIITGTG